jgi:hypothetical protein
MHSPKSEPQTERDRASPRAWDLLIVELGINRDEAIEAPSLQQ